MNNETAGNTSSGELQGSNGTIYVINSFSFNIKGYTRPFALIYKAELAVGEEIIGFENLEKYINEKRQLLYNERVLESVDIEYTISEVRQDGKYPVDLLIHVTDTWNIIAIPRPQYSSNSGFDITIKARDYNFLGTMSPLRLDIGYSYDEEGNNSFDLMLDTDIPFRLFDLNWSFNFDHDFSYRPNLSESYYYKNTTGISVELPFNNTIFTVGFNESFILNEENARRYRKKYGRFQEGFYLSSNPYISWKIPTGLYYYDLGEINYTPKLSATFNHELEQSPLDDHRKGPFFNFSHNLSFGRIDWIDNFLKGFSASINNSFSYDLYKFNNDDQPWGGSFSLTGSGYKIINSYFNFSSRLMYRQWFFDDYTDSGGDVIRGVLDNDITANYMLSLNMDFTFKVLRFLPSVWSGNEKARIIDFDFHVTPFLDVAFYNDHVNQRPFGLENMLIGAGLEVVIFPLRFRSLFLRVSVAVGIEAARLSRGLSNEIFIGTELHY
ncbi:MAG: hypothetical protein LBI28_07335 [Treponema sp.]|nr:hypothetical protein [Treponema sp.]